MYAPAFFAAVKDGAVIATTASSIRKYRHAVLYGRTVAYWSSNLDGARRQLEVFHPMRDGKPIAVEIVDVVETDVRLAVGDPWPLGVEVSHV